jgi:hypothetical protein
VTASSKRASPRSPAEILAGQRDGAHGVDGGLQAQMVGAGHERTLARTDRFPFGGHFHFAVAARGDSSVTSTGKSARR